MRPGRESDRSSLQQLPLLAQLQKGRNGRRLLLDAGLIDPNGQLAELYLQAVS
jgi:hypothetical protein